MKARTSRQTSRSATLFLFSVVVLLAGGAAAVHGQSALDGFDPNANGQISVVVVQPDGKILIGGEYTTLSPNGGAAVTRNHIARLNPDGTLDTAFDPNANGYVVAIVIQADGKILVGGQFSSIGGQTRNYIARLDATTGLADSFDPNVENPPDCNNNPVHAIAVQADGKILVGGCFSNIGGQTRSFIARLDLVTGLADSFNPNANELVEAIKVQADGKILVAGSFTNIGGQARNFIARLDPTTGLDDSFNPNANDIVRSVAVQTDGKILAAGNFTSIGGQTRNRIARLDATTGAADSFNPNPNGNIFSIAVQTDGKILVGGFFTSIGGQTRNNIARLDATTGLADSFDPNANSNVWSIAVQADGKILAGGAFTTLAPNGGAPATRNNIARLENDGRLDQTLDLSISGPVGSIVHANAVQPDGKILIGGSFTTVLGVPRNNIARLNTDGTLDTAFNPNANAQVKNVAVQADGKILVVGDFSGANSIGGKMRNFIARLDATTGLADDLFDPNANGIVASIVVQADGKIVAGGFFTSIGGHTRNYIVRLDATNGLADDAWDPNPNAPVRLVAVLTDGKILAGGDFTTLAPNGGAPVTRNHIARLDATTGLADSWDPNATGNTGHVFAFGLQADGKILVGGFFQGIGRQPRNSIARLDPTTGLADSWNPNAGSPSSVDSIAVQADGKVLVGGVFTSIGGQPRNSIARLDPTTGSADSFDPNATGGSANSITLQADGKIRAAGNFTSIGGQPRSLFARLSNDTAALQNLTATQTTITWTRGGSSQQFTRVRFESSTDNVNYTSLGNGVPQSGGSDWTLTGLSLPTGQNIYVRARGYYRCGYINGSESLTESVRYGPAAIPTPTLTPPPTPPPTLTPSPTATPTPTPTPTPRPATLGNISTRLQVGTGASVMIAGFIVQGTVPKRVLIRAAGPSLTQFGVSNAMANPRVELHNTTGTIGMNNDWQTTQISGVITADQVTEIQNSGLAPSDPAESALIATLAPGTYTAIVEGVNNGTGVGIVEVYDLASASASLLGNISTRGFVQTGDDAMIGGFIVVTQPTRVIIRAIGPSLTQFGVPDALANPQLELHDASGTIAQNNDWQTTQIGGIVTMDQIAEIQASGLAPTNSAESAIIATLPMGTYTAIVRGVSNTTGNGLVEVYALQ